MKRVLLTGATGFIGHHALVPLRERGYEVHAVSRTLPRHRHDGVTWHAADLLSEGAAKKIVSVVEPTHLLHFAWFAVPGDFWSSPENIRWRASSLALIRAFAETSGERVVVAGTCAEYDWSNGVCVEGVTRLAPKTLYGRCKHELHERVAALAGETGLGAAWGRIFFLYGPREHPARLVSSVVTALLEGREAPCSDGYQVRDFLHVADVASAFVAILDRAVDGPVNIASGRPARIRDVVSTIGERIGRSELIRFGALPTRDGDPPRILADVTRLSEDVGWAPRYSLEEGLEDTIRWWRRRLGTP